MTGAGQPNTFKTLGFLGPETALTRAIAAFDWPQTELGPIDAWPAELRTAIG